MDRKEALGNNEQAISSIEMDDDEPGKTKEKLVFWLIENALSSAEDILDRQEKHLDAKRAQATSMLGWFVSITTAITFATVSTNKISVGACIAAISSIPCCCCAYVLMPKTWGYKQFHPKQYIDAKEDSEKEFKFRNALGLQQVIDKNSEILQRIEKALFCGWIIFCSIPISGLLIYFIFS